MKMNTTIRFMHEVEEAEERHRQRDHQAREADPAQQVLAADEARHRARGGFLEVGEQDDRLEQVLGVVGTPCCLSTCRTLVNTNSSTPKNSSGRTSVHR